MAKLSWLLSRAVITPVTAGLFVLVSLTGIGLLAHVESRAVKETHELFGVLFVAGALVHLALNWRCFAGYLRRPATAILAACVGVLGVLLLVGTSDDDRGASPADMLRLLEEAPLAHVVPLVGVEIDQAAKALRQQGFTIGDVEQTLRDIAHSNRRPVPEVLGIVYRSKSPAASG